MAAKFEEVALVSLYLCLFLLFSSVSVVCEEEIEKREPDPLYTESDNIVLLDGENFSNRVLDTDCAWIVEFYSSWCGHCIAFAPEYKRLAAEVKGWHEVINIGGVDCALEKNSKLCRDYNITSFPTISFFEAHSKAHDLGYKYDGNKTVEDIKKGMVDHIIRHHPSDRPNSWPQLEPAWYTTTSSFWSEISDKNPDIEYVALVFQEPYTFYGLYVILDLLPLKNMIVRVVFKDNELLVKELKVTEFPSIYMLKKNGEYFKVSRDTFLTRGITGAESLLMKVASRGGQEFTDWKRVMISDHFAKKELEKENIPEKYSFQNGAGFVQNMPERPLTYVHMQDLESGLHYSFRQEISAYQSIAGEHLKALISYINILAKYFPGRPPVKRYLTSVASLVNAFVSSNPTNPRLESHTWLNILEKATTPDSYLPKVHKFVGCLGSKTYLRGYPCSLWTLWHVLTVAEQHAAYNTESSYRPMEVLTAMRGYIGQFFSCRECSENFLKMAAALEAEVDLSNPDSSVMWLWRAHNKANKRLKGAKSEDPHFPKVQFPSSFHCPKCHLSTLTAATASQTQEENWNLDVVRSFLTQHYSKDLIVQQGLLDYHGAIVNAAEQTSSTRANRRKVYDSTQQQPMQQQFQQQPQQIQQPLQQQQQFQQQPQQIQQPGQQQQPFEQQPQQPVQQQFQQQQSQQQQVQQIQQPIPEQQHQQYQLESHGIQQQLLDQQQYEQMRQEIQAEQQQRPIQPLHAQYQQERRANAQHVPPTQELYAPVPAHQADQYGVPPPQRQPYVHHQQQGPVRVDVGQPYPDDGGKPAAIQSKYAAFNRDVQRKMDEWRRAEATGAGSRAATAAELGGASGTMRPAGGGWGWLGVSGIDVSMCVLLYGVCSAILLCVYCLVSRRRVPASFLPALRRNRCKLPI